MATNRRSQSPPSPGERLVRRTGAGLAFFTLALIAILLAVVGVVTAAAVAQMTDASVDSNLHTAAENMLIALAPTPSPQPQTTAAPQISAPPTLEPSEDAGATPDNTPGGDDPTLGGEGEGDGTSLRSSPPTVAPSAPQPSVTPAPAPTQTPTPRPTPTLRPATVTPVAGISVGPSPSDRPPESSDTFFLILDHAGAVLANPQNMSLSGLPNADAAAVAATGTEDWRTVDSNGVPIRLLSEPMYALDGTVAGVLQSGFVLTAHEQQKVLIVQTIIIASLAGLLGAAVVTLFVTRRAMAPIRAAFDAERRFVASASHELKTPVSVVRASAEILQREDLVKPEGRYLVDDVVAESDRLGRLVGDLLALASAEAGQISIEPTTFDQGVLVRETVERVQAVAAERGVHLTAVNDGGSGGKSGELLVTADRERMVQLLRIFIDNAIDHSPPNGVVTVAARSVGDANRGPKRVVVEVTDQGPGVPIADRERIFEPFERAAGARRSNQTTGLGLAIARILAARQHATLAIRDAPGGGACFSVSLAQATGGRTTD